MPRRRFDPDAFLDQLDSLREAPTTQFTAMIPAELLWGIGPIGWSLGR